MGCFFSVFPPLSLLATLPPGLGVWISMRDRRRLAKPVRIAPPLCVDRSKRAIAASYCASVRSYEAGDRVWEIGGGVPAEPKSDSPNAP